MLLFAAVPILWLASSPQNFEIRLPPGMTSGSLTGRYQTTGSAGVHDGFIGSTSIPIGPGISEIKGVFYAPGCQIETFAMSLPSPREPEYEFQCRPLRSIPLDGRVDKYSPAESDKRYKVQVVYAAYWAHDLFGKDGDLILTTLPVGNADIGADGRFHVDLPDLAHDPIAGDPGRPGTLQFHLRDAASGTVFGELLPVTQTARMGGLLISPSYPKGLVFRPCTTPSRALRSAEGFASRGGFNDRGCDLITH